MKSVPLQALFISLAAMVAAGALTISFEMQLFGHNEASEPRRGGITALSPKPASPATPAASKPAPDLALSSPGRRPTNGIPSFDIVRIDPDGGAVIAGRSAPGRPVELLRGSEVLAREVADHAGEFVMLLPRLPSGRYKLTLRAKLPDGTDVTSERSVGVQVDLRHLSPAMLGHAKPATPLPITAEPVGASVQDTAPPVLSPVTIAHNGKVTVTGRAPPGAMLKVYLNDTFVASVSPGRDQLFSVTINKGLASGRYLVRVDRINPASNSIVVHTEQQFDVSPAQALASTPVQTNASVDGIGRIDTAKVDGEQPQSSTEPASAPLAGGSPSHVVLPKIVTATVARGDSLWRISQKSYGSGDLYPLIFKANKGKIRNPDLIYPSQVFVLPPR